MDSKVNTKLDDITSVPQNLHYYYFPNHCICDLSLCDVVVSGFLLIHVNCMCHQKQHKFLSIYYKF